ncbi:MAG TPA: sigma-70 family RNA polymerase sigma factor [Dehalococcoidia bacterium]|nr:sigma-70 family RNA polymerase sigma factor [Dehalococcoidia bacterium]
MTSDAPSNDLQSELEQSRIELTAYCYRMLGSAFEAEDAVQETMLRAWRNAGGFQGRSSLSTWLYRIATNVCLDMLSGAKRRARPMDFASAGRADSPLGDTLDEANWVLPIPDSRILPDHADPADVAEARDSVRLAFVAALQRLPARQRAVLILREVLDWQASEVAELLGTSVASVNSALQRARASLATGDGATGSAPVMDERRQALLTRYVDAFERYDMDALTSLLHEDASWSMPPFPLWLQTHFDIRSFCLGPGIACRDSILVPVMANGSPAFGQYKPDGGGGHEPWALQVVEISGAGISGVTFFLDTARLFPLFGLPLQLDR